MKDKPFVLQTYKKEAVYSYTSGAYATVELLHARSELVRAVYIHSKCDNAAPIETLCRANAVPVYYGDKYFTRVNQKENAYVMGVFEKYYGPLSGTRPHLLLVNPGDMGNIGTIVRTAVGFGLQDVGIVLPAGDIFHPKTVRASMGALFHARIQSFDSFEAYRAAHGSHHCYPFMLDGAEELHRLHIIRHPFTLIFGNEASGLDTSFADCGVSVRIPQTARVDSYNVAIAVGIGAFVFMNAHPYP